MYFNFFELRYEYEVPPYEALTGFTSPFENIVAVASSVTLKKYGVSK